MRHILSVLGILLGLTLLTACSSPPQTPPPIQSTASPVQETEIPVPAFNLKDAEGKSIGFTPGTDDFTLLEVWAPTWFEQSDEQFQRLQEIHERFGNRGVRVLCLAYETDPPRVRQAIQDHSALFDVALGEEATFDMLQLQSLPTTWILDRQGHPLQRLEGYQPLETLEKHLEEALSGPSEAEE